MIIYFLIYSCFMFISIKEINKHRNKKKNKESSIIDLFVLPCMNGFFLAYLFQKIVIFLPWDNFILVGLTLLIGTIFAAIFEKNMEQKSLLKNYTYCIYELSIMFMSISIVFSGIVTSFIYGIYLYLGISHIIPEKISKNALIYHIFMGILGFFVGIAIFFK